jgi:predicted aminopeptidase
MLPGMTTRSRKLLRWLLRGTGGTALLAAVVLGAGLMIPGCPVGYVTRESANYLRILAAREPVDRAIEQGLVADEWRPKIEVLRDAKRFGAERLGLPAEDLYETISLVRPGPSWIVTACAKDSLTPVTWWFPIVGEVAYKGFYRREQAERQAERLGDVDLLLYPVSAFSTLGWFDDPIRPSMLRRDEEDLANLVLHEAAHRVLYWKGQTDFNESFASFVGDVGAILYLEDRLGPDCEPCIRARSARADARLFSVFIEGVVERLRSLYAEPIEREEKIRHREDVFAWAKEHYREIPWEGNTYDHFLERDLDNAVILSYRRYDAGQEVFDRLLESCGGDLTAAMGFVRDLGWPELPRVERQRLAPMKMLEERLDAGTACPSAD